MSTNSLARSGTFDIQDFRQALGMFATGVTIVTTSDSSQGPVGITVNSFNSVSLEPPMVLWSISKSAHSRPAFSENLHWNVHILSQEQEALSNKFAKAGENKFSGLALEKGSSKAPLIPGCSARFQCRTAFEYDGGDHVIFIGHVIAYDRSARDPLLYLTGAYALASRRAADVATQSTHLVATPYSENLIGYLLGRAHYQFMAGFREQLNFHKFNDLDFFVLSLLVVREPMQFSEIETHIVYTGMVLTELSLSSMQARQLIHKLANNTYELSLKGSNAIMHVLSAAKTTEANLIKKIGEHEFSLLRNILKKSILASDPGLPKLWANF
jgi:3-hydroxy-9,10-secoandrosta-1,3,5(10)-triene-9,17-dione monooxygenase reductase component